MSIRYTSKFKLDINAFNEVYLNKITCLAFQLQQVKDTCREHFLCHTRNAKKILCWMWSDFPRQFENDFHMIMDFAASH